MIKTFLISFCFIQLASADCQNRFLHCFDENGIRYPHGVEVGQCWSWYKLTCEPCHSQVIDRKKSYKRYLPLCQYYFPGAVSVLDTKSFWQAKMNEILQKW
jgi:hypothetical protein